MLEIKTERQSLLETLEGKFDAHNIKVLCFDADDTLFDTNELFAKWMRRFVSSVVDKSQKLDWKEVWSTFVKFNDEAYHTHSVQKEKLLTVSEKLDGHFGTGSLFTSHTDVVLQIWNKAPMLLDGAREALEIFSAVRPLVLVTHAEKRWTDIKLDERDIRKYFHHIHTVRPDKFKGPEDWLEGITTAGFMPQEALGFGDNLKGDALACKEIGMKHFFLIKSPWKVYQAGVMVDGITPIGHIRNSVKAVIDNL